MGVKNFMINKLFMKNKKIWIILTVVALTFLFVGAVSAADNTATDTVKIKEKQNKEIINVKQTQSTNNEVSNVRTYNSCMSNVQTSDNTKHKVLINAPSKTFKYKSNSHFKISLKDYNTHNPLKNKKVKIKISLGKIAKSKYYKTNSKGVISLNTKNLKLGTYKVSISIKASKDYYAASKNSKIRITNKVPYSIIVPLEHIYAGSFIHQYKLKTGQKLHAYYQTEDLMDTKGIYIGTSYPAQHVFNTRLLKAQIYFESQSTGKMISKIYTKTDPYHYNMKRINLIKGYTPIKAKVWYRHK